ncbi:MAG: carboxylesterase [Acidobacteria bacterium]|nr:MAG: carboxylesterase [Acidobacteriota bacterium]
METTDILPAIVQEPPGEAQAAVIWMHGLGASGHDFAGVPPELGLPRDLQVRYVFPHAPRIPVTINMGLIMPAWYDVASLDARGQDERGIRRSEAMIRALIERETERGVPAEKIVLAGFSQGGAMALHTGLRYPERLAGIMVLSAYLVLHDKLAGERSEANLEVPIFQAHGRFDPMIPIAAAERSRDYLQSLGYDVEWHEYPMEHAVCLEEIQAIGRWLTRVLADDVAGGGC